MTATETRPAPAPERRSGELNLRELLRWTWRQLTSMRIALILLLLLALAAVPGSLVPQERVDSLKASQWKEAHPSLAPVYEKLGIFNVYGSPWFAAIYILLVVSLLGCIIPRTFVYARGLGAQPPAAPRNLTRLPSHAAYGTTEPAEVVLERARALLKRKRYRVRRESDGASVSAERGYLRELGNLVFHLAVLVVLVGFATGTLFGYKGGVILVEGQPFSNNLTQYDDFVPGSLFDPDGMDPFTFTVNHFDVEWLRSGPRAGMARGFDAELDYTRAPGEAERGYDLRVNHPLKIGDTELFLIGHGYAPVVTVRDGDGNVAASGPVPFLPMGPDLFSFGVVKAQDAEPSQIGLEGYFYPTFASLDGTPVNLGGDDVNPLLSLSVYAGDLNMNSGAAQSVYTLDKSKAAAVRGDDGKPLRLNLAPGETAQLPDGLGSVTFDKVVSWQRIQISQTPGKDVALLGVVLALLGLMGSLFIRSRRVWVRVSKSPDGTAGTVVEVAALDRSGGADTDAVLSKLVAALQAAPSDPEEEP
jgi:cytochrome c biogenesis protein